MVLIVLFALMVLLGLFSLAYPWTFERRSDRIWMHLPLVMLLIYGAYEVTMPRGTNIRVDWLLLFPFIWVVLAVYAIKLWLSSRKKSRP